MTPRIRRIAAGTEKKNERGRNTTAGRMTYCIEPLTKGRGTQITAIFCLTSLLMTKTGMKFFFVLRISCGGSQGSLII